MYKFLIRAAMALSLLASHLLINVIAQNESFWERPIEKCWSYSSDQMTSVKIASDNESTLFIPFANDEIIAIDANTGEPVWTKRLKSTVISDPTAQNGTLSFAALPSSEAPSASEKLLEDRFIKIFSVDIESGLNNWIRNIYSKESEDLGEVFVFLSQTAAIVIQKSGIIHVLDRRDGEVLWDLDTDTTLTGPPAVGPNQIILPTQNRTIVILDVANGHIANQITTQILPNRVQLNGSRLVVGDQEGNVRMLGFPDGKLIWKNRTGGAIREFKEFKGDVLAISNDNYAYRFSSENGDTVWKRKLSGRILGSTVLDGKVGAFLSTGSIEALFVSLKDGNIVNRIAPGDADYFLSSPISIGERIVLPTDKGLETYGPNCPKRSKS